jgi:hypothetical protein
VSAEPRSLVRVTLLDVGDSLAMAATDQQTASELVQQGKLQDAMPHISQALQAWENVRAAVDNGAALLGLDVNSLRVATSSGQREVRLGIESLSRDLDELKRCIRAQDWSGLADSLGFQMQDQAREWRELLQGMAQSIELPGGTS